MAQSSITPAQFAVSLLGRLGIRQSPGAVQALVGWQAAEGGNWHNGARFNPLNTTQPAPGAGNTGSQGDIKVYRDWNQGLDATAQTLKNGRYGGILRALQAGDPGQVAREIGRTPWGTSGDLVARTIAGASGAASGGVPSSPVARAASSSSPAAASGMDPSALAALLSQTVAPAPRQSMGLAAPAFAAQAPMTGQQLVTSGVRAPAPGAQLSAALAAIRGLGGGSGGSAAPVAPGAPAGGSGPVSAGGGVVHVAPGANREGVGLTPGILGVVRRVAAVAGEPLTIGTGTNHNRLTVDGNVSDHWSGNATDIPARGPALTKLGQDALIAAGMPAAQARQQQGGLYNIPQPGGGRVQIIFQSHIGGDHTNHLHVGISGK